MAVYGLKVHKQVEKFLLNLIPVWRIRFRDKLEMLRQYPHHHPQLDIKLLLGLRQSIYRLRIGTYRMIYEIHENELLIYLMKAGS